MAWCGNCKEEFSPVEYRPADPDDLNFCSDRCEDKFWEAVENEAVYVQARYGGAPLF